MLHGSETWPIGKENEVALQRAEMRMLRWMCGVKLQDRVPSKGFRERLGLDDIILVLQQYRLRWYQLIQVVLDKTLRAIKWLCLCVCLPLYSRAETCWSRQVLPPGFFILSMSAAKARGTDGQTDRHQTNALHLTAMVKTARLLLREMRKEITSTSGSRSLK